MEATGEGAALALIISGEKPDPERFEPKRLEGIATGTPTVLVDALIVPIRVKKPLKDGLDALEQLMSFSTPSKPRRRAGPSARGSSVLPPFNSYNCP